MARFETPCQVISLFVTAAAVAVVLILFLNAEVRHRDHEKTEGEALLVKEEVSAGADNTRVTKRFRLANYYLKETFDAKYLVFLVFRSENVEMDPHYKHRSKRHVDTEYYGNFVIEGEYDESVIDDPPEKSKTARYQNSNLSQSLLSSSLKGHKIRNIKEKVRKLQRHSQVIYIFYLPETYSLFS